MTYYLGDVPAEPFVIEPPDSLNLDEFTSAEASVIGPSETYADDIAATVTETEIVVDLPTYSIFTEPGVYRLRVRLVGADGSQGIPDLAFVVQDPDEQWHTLDSLRREWPDAEYIADATLFELLEVARVQCVAFARALAADEGVPVTYCKGQAMQTRNLWNASKVAPDGGVGQDDFIIRPFPLDWHVKAILRPKHGIPVIG